MVTVSPTKTLPATSKYPHQPATGGDTLAADHPTSVSFDASTSPQRQRSGTLPRCPMDGSGGLEQPSLGWERQAADHERTHGTHDLRARLRAHGGLWRGEAGRSLEDRGER